MKIPLLVNNTLRTTTYLSRLTYKSRLFKLPVNIIFKPSGLISFTERQLDLLQRDSFMFKQKYPNDVLSDIKQIMAERDLFAKTLSLYNIKWLHKLFSTPKTQFNSQKFVNNLMELMKPVGLTNSALDSILTSPQFSKLSFPFLQHCTAFYLAPMNFDFNLIEDFIKNLIGGALSPKLHLFTFSKGFSGANILELFQFVDFVQKINLEDAAELILEIHVLNSDNSTSVYTKTDQKLCYIIMQQPNSDILIILKNNKRIYLDIKLKKLMENHFSLKGIISIADFELDISYVKKYLAGIKSALQSKIVLSAKEKNGMLAWINELKYLTAAIKKPPYILNEQQKKEFYNINKKYLLDPQVVNVMPNFIFEVQPELLDINPLLLEQWVKNTSWIYQKVGLFQAHKVDSSVMHKMLKDFLENMPKELQPVKEDFIANWNAVCNTFGDTHKSLLIL